DSPLTPPGIGVHEHIRPPWRVRFKSISGEDGELAVRRPGRWPAEECRQLIQRRDCVANWLRGSEASCTFHASKLPAGEFQSLLRRGLKHRIILQLLAGGLGQIPEVGEQVIAADLQPLQAGGCAHRALEASFKHARYAK